MSLNALTIRDVNDTGKRMEVIGSLTLTGNYTAGGDPISFAAAVMAELAAGLAGVPSSEAPIYAAFTGRSSGYVYVYTRGSGRDNGKLRIFSAFGTELTGGAALPAGVTGDTIDFVAIFRKLI